MKYLICMIGLVTIGHIFELDGVGDCRTTRDGVEGPSASRYSRYLCAAIMRAQLLALQLSVLPCWAFVPLDVPWVPWVLAS